LTRADMDKPDRKQLVGILTEDIDEVLPEGAQLVEHPQAQPPMTMIGHVSSSYHSPNIGRSIALALVKGGRARIGQTIHAPLKDKTVACKVTEPVFFDPSGERLRA
nr:glycine cleavage T C-terminal barrel domain-containing protein [Kiloniellales bacterium]